ncbi:MAG: YbbR-like domain-containing protein [Bacteroides sp.]|nr:YbbR-like domain-containing protein [Bacteroides sp.]
MNHFKQLLRKTYVMAARALRTAKGRNVLLYLLFVCVAFVFWLLMSLDSEVQRNYDLPLQIDNLPDSITLISDVPPSISTTVQGKGSQLVRFMWGNPSPLKIPFLPEATSNGVFTLPALKLEARLRDYFGNGVMILNSRPDSIKLVYTTGPGKRLPLIVESDISTDLQSIQSGFPSANVDSVTVYAPGHIPASLRAIHTEMLTLSGVKDTSSYEVRVVAPEGMRVIPDHVTVTVPVEPLIAKKRHVEINATGLPKGTRMLMFPASVEVVYLVPMSHYSDDYPIRAYVNYNDAVSSKSDKVEVLLGPIPGRAYSISHTPDSVEFVIEHEHH